MKLGIQVKNPPVHLMAHTDVRRVIAEENYSGQSRALKKLIAELEQIKERSLFFNAVDEQRLAQYKERLKALTFKFKGRGAEIDNDNRMRQYLY